MATRDITDIFLMMRNNAAQNRMITTELNDHDLVHDRMALVVDVEHGGQHTAACSRLPPGWVDSVQEVQYETSRIRDKLRELQVAHNRCLNRPTLDDSEEEERVVEVVTGELNQIFHRCERLVQDIRSRTLAGSRQEQRMSNNVVHALASSLTELTGKFRQEEAAYLRKLRTREERSRTLTSFGSKPDAQRMMSVSLHDDYDTAPMMEGTLSHRLQMSEQLLQENTELVEVREREITEIVRSIGELNSIFKDLSGMIVEQGTLLDRIDYNVEVTCVKIEEGYKQLQKAEKYQKKNRKMYVILTLFIVTLILLILLIVTRS